MSAAFDAAAVERAAAGRALRLPRVPHRGRLGEVRSASTGSSLELQDFRLYHPGDDLRQLDWNAVARTGELVLRVRQDEVAPRVELLVDTSRSLAVSPEKAARTQELALLLYGLAERGGLEPAVVLVGSRSQRARGGHGRALLERLSFEGREPFDVALNHAPTLEACGLRLVVSDLLFEAPVQRLAERLGRRAAGLTLLQVLDSEDIAPTGGAGARLEDVESGEALERVLTGAVLEDYRARFEAHQALWREAAQRVQASLLSFSAQRELPSLASAELLPLWEDSGR